jgi:DNA invertase Pin-like site-specific DNA recombinase
MTNSKMQTHPAVTRDHLRRLAVIYVRQSTQFQVRTNTGSTEFQRSLVAVPRSYGWPESQIEIIDEDLAKSGSSSQKRTGWQRLQRMIEAKQVGAVFTANISRLARQVLDFELFRLRAALHDTLLYADGRFINPADSNDTVSSQLIAMVAQLENRKRAEVMMQAAMSKAKRGQAVSKLPTGWIKGPDGKYDYDPQSKDAIQIVIKTFWETRSIRQTVIKLAKAGVQLPSRKKSGELYFTKPTDTRVIFILTNPAYAGTYVFARTKSQPGEAVSGDGQSKRKKLPLERWIKIRITIPLS